MAAFNYTAAQQIYANIRQLYYRRRAVGCMTLTHDEFVQLFVPTAEREIYKAAAALTTETPLWQGLNVESPAHGTLAAMVFLRDVPGSFAPPVPRRPEIQPDAPEELRLKFDSWITNGADSSRDYGRVNKVFEYLNANCSKQAMRYYWPSIIAICSVDDRTKGYASELQELKIPSSPKPLPQRVLQACKKTAETISTVQLIDPAFTGPDRSTAPVTIEMTQGRTYKEPIGTIYGLT